MLAQLAGLFIALAVAFVLASFAKSVLGRVPTHSAESNARGAASGLSLSEKRDYEQQLLRNRKQQQSSASSSPAPQSEAKSAPAAESKPVMQPPRTDLAPPKDDPFTMEQLKEFDGADLSKPIYVAIKGTIFDVSHKPDTYGKGKSYNLFAGKDASRALGMSSLKPEDAVSDYSTLTPADMKTLNDWFDFFSKRYNVVGKVIDLPPQGSSAPTTAAL